MHARAEHFVNFSVRYVIKSGLKIRNQVDAELYLLVGSELLIPDGGSHPDEWAGMSDEYIPVRVFREPQLFKVLATDLEAYTSEKSPLGDGRLPLRHRL